MTDIYQRIDGSEYRNIFVVGDIHGCYDRLMSQLSELKFDQSKDLLVSVGDIIDRGPQSLQCLALINEEWFRCVRGNHEQMAIDAPTKPSHSRMWFNNGGHWFSHLDSDQQMYARDLIIESAKLPLFIDLQTSNQKVVIAHADYPDNAYELGKPVSEYDALWGRDRFNNIVDGHGGEITGADQFYFGHTPIERHIKAWNQNYIDTGAVFGGMLTIVQVQSGGR